MTQPSGEAAYVEAEEQAADDVEEAVAAALAAGMTAAALAALVSAITRLLDAATRSAFALAYTHTAGSSPRRRTRRDGVRQRAAQLRARFRADTAGAVRTSINAAVKDLADGMDPAEALGRLTRRLRTTAETLVNQAISAGVEAAAKAHGAVGLMWVTEADPCPQCRKLAGTVVKIGQKWQAPRGSTWRRFKGRPPLHPACRCRARAVWGQSPRPADQALRRGAHQRAGRRTRRRGVPGWARN